MFKPGANVACLHLPGLPKENEVTSLNPGCLFKSQSQFPEIACVILPEGHFHLSPHWSGRRPHGPKRPKKLNIRKSVDWGWVCGHKGNWNQPHKQLPEAASPTNTTSYRPLPLPTRSGPPPSPPAPLGSRPINTSALQGT